MVEALRKYENSATNDEHPRAEVESPSTGLPPLQYVDDHEGWSTFEGPILYFYAGKGPYVSRYKLFQLLQLFSLLCLTTYSRELMQFPVSLPNDGMVDLVIQGRVRTYPFLSLGAPFERPPPVVPC
jgi:sphingosine kinase